VFYIALANSACHSDRNGGMPCLPSRSCGAAALKWRNPSAAFRVYYRTDIGDRWAEDPDRLHAWGYVRWET
jgi:hypothetical protein